MPAFFASLAVLPAFITAPVAAMAGGQSGARLRTIVSRTPGLSYFPVAGVGRGTVSTF